MKVLLAGASLLPHRGGIAHSVCGLARALSGAGVDVAVWAPDQSAAATPLLNGVEAVRRLVGSAGDAVAGIELIHDNGIWWLHNHRLAMIATKRAITRVVSTRGMLEPWAMQHKGFKKRIAWRLYQRHDLVHARCHHATSEVEAANVRQLGLGAPVWTIPNGIDIPAGHSRTEKVDSRAHSRRRVALFLGRLYPVKGLPLLIRAWGKIRPGGWVLRIAGPDEAGHQAELERVIAAEGLTEAITFCGAVDAVAKRSVLTQADLFILPTLSENFGTVVAEALAHGVPVITTKQAPWAELRERHCGWWVDPSVDDIARALSQATSMTREALASMGERGRSFAVESFGWDTVAKRFVDMYESMKASQGRPVRRAR